MSRAVSLINRIISGITAASGHSAISPDPDGRWFSVPEGGVISQLMDYKSGTYAARPAASAVNAGMLYIATDIGIAPGCLFRSTGSAWQQVGMHRLFILTANIAISTTTETSVFSTGVGSKTLPNGCLAIGTMFSYGARALETGGGAATAAIAHKSYIGATAAGTAAAYDNAVAWATLATDFFGEMIVRTLGATGTIMASGDMKKNNNGYFQGSRIRSDTATTIDTTVGISPDFKITLSAIAGAPVLTIDSSWLDVSGLV